MRPFRSWSPDASFLASLLPQEYLELARSRDEGPPAARIAFAFRFYLRPPADPGNEDKASRLFGMPANMCYFIRQQVVRLEPCATL